FIERLMTVNLFLAGFNLLPAFPMDGGRVLRALLAMRTDYVRATQVAASVGQGMAFLFGLIGLLSNPVLLFIAFFVWIGAQQEASMVMMKSALGGIPVRQAMVSSYRTLSPGDDLNKAVQYILDGSQQDFPVLEGDRVVGMLTRGDLMAALSRQGPSAAVEEVMRRDFETIDAGEMIEMAFARLQACDCHSAPVLYNDRLAGLLTMDNVGEFLMIQTALSKRGLQQSVA
ncbi:MAG: CBS domain-containing protein, partial [Anaerolineae bacterium]|nr:CBS domain-containing protein [Anaerolineae bacterium]